MIEKQSDFGLQSVDQQSAIFPMTISVAIVAMDEEANIGRTLASVRWADEIVLVDSGSTRSHLRDRAGARSPGRGRTVARLRGAETVRDRAVHQGLGAAAGRGRGGESGPGRGNSRRHREPERRQRLQTSSQESVSGPMDSSWRFLSRSQAASVQAWSGICHRPRSARPL